MQKNIMSAVLASALLITGCAGNGATGSNIKENGVRESRENAEEAAEAGSGRPVRFKVEPETFALTLFDGEEKLEASLPGEQKEVEALKESEDGTEWFYPQQNMRVTVTPETDHLAVTFISDSGKDNTVNWPAARGDYFYLPMGEGKRVPGKDEGWAKYLTDMDFTVMESLSMPFFAVSQGDKALVYIMEDPYRTELHFEDPDGLEVELRHSYPEIAPNKSKGFRIYVTDNEPVRIAGVYKDYLKETGRFTTLEQKAGRNQEVQKLYGAPHFYLWCSRAVEPEDINWTAFRSAAGEPAMAYVAEYVKSQETGSEFGNVLNEIRSQDYVSRYQQNVICRGITEAVAGRDFYDRGRLPEPVKNAKGLPGAKELNEPERIALNKAALYANLPGVFITEPENWGTKGSAGLIEEMKAGGIDKAWIGLDNWENAWRNPKLVQAAADAGYLIGPYDSYHSIHEPGKEEWNTAAFKDHTLYEEAAIENRGGEKVAGFNEVGRKLNPMLALPSVKDRTSWILGTGVPFNSWFVDCDAAGELYDDYTPSRRTTMEQDTAARMERLDYIGEELGMVVGSEGGNDYAVQHIAFAHGIELPSFSWRDQDMKKNKESKYYIGKYYSASGGVPEHFGKKIPLKEEWSHIFTDISFDVPLYRLVYNNSVITTYHWDWSTLKIEGEETARMMREILYHVPPLYHLDRETWDREKETITAHVKVWSEFAGKAAREEMTDFEYLSEDGKVQRTEFGKDLEVAANFSEEPFLYQSIEIPPGNVLIRSGDSVHLYCPQVY
ncbi:glycoside hydrolase [[Clostridium] symbiosum]|uniref:glycoside hydrolase n=1 Tax=Clostridium symbiosum TaxID=1512 RepID=UPI001D05E9ED|nr:glycoside hydrolase [[Clostridium] symbiosum]MCB6607297.1 glycoside hydrolase [[Clostridium] symbiosum]MCB6929857.1 glycoside hydrolase [[Clostridium] symbiosum]